mmetsp:Transcript_4200/g.10791  ORF Transcript_4200/g.10791 Transcript_4200/m.10791 type:complete len:272 (-) Transcript_4200:93-908(-)
MEESIFAIAAGGGGQFVESVVMQDVDAGSRVRSKLPAQPVVYYKTAPHQDSGQISNIFNPVRGVRDAMRRQGKQPRNHARDNLMAIRNQSAQNKLQKELAAKLPVQRKPSSKGPSSNYGRSSSKQASPTRRAGGSNKDFISQNKSALQGMKSKKQGKEPEQLFKEKENYGKMPRYLLQRKLEIAEEYERQREAERHALAPAGTRLMPEDERLQTLAMLESNKVEVEKHLSLLPFVAETPSQIKTKTNLERRLQEIEEAERLFSRPIVYVKV